MVMWSLTDKHYIVSGGGRGIGLEICKAIIEAGGHVAVLDILMEAQSECQELITTSGGKCHYISCDVTEADSLEPGFNDAMKALGGHLDGCVTCAGVGTDKPFLDHTREDFDRVVRVNQAGTFFLAQLAVRQLLQQPLTNQETERGNIVLIASIAAAQHCPGHYLTAYAGTKGWVRSFCTHLSHEFAREGIRVNSVSPGYTNTELNRNLAKIRPEIKHFFTEAPPMKRMGQPRDVAGGVVYLLSDGASYITGHDLVIDGGMSTGNGLTR